MRSTTTNGVTQAITYDGNGNTLNSGGRVLTWNADNQPTQASNWPTSEQYLYDADGERVKRTNVNLGVTTYYLGSLYVAMVGASGREIGSCLCTTHQ